MTAEIATVTFANFDVYTDDVSTIGAVDGGPGVEAQLREAFRVSETLTAKEAIGVIAPHAKLQDNIELGASILSDPGVQAVLDYEPDTSPFVIARDLGVRSGLQDAVARPFMRPMDEAEVLRDHFDAAVLPERVRRWWGRMAKIAIGLAEDGVQIDRVIGISSKRKVGMDECDDFEPGTTTNRMLLKLLGELGDMKKGGEDDENAEDLFGAVELLHVPGTGLNGMRTVAQHFKGQLSGRVDLTSARILLPAVAGNWMQTGAQARTALREIEPAFDEDPQRPQLYVVSDSLPLGETGQESKVTHQNPISALGNIARGFALLKELQGAR